ncbi:MAG: hypothetical protein ACEQSO_08160 [Aquirufa sp.]
MDVVKKLYLQAYFFVMALYVFFNKGIAYSFLAEAMWAECNLHPLPIIELALGVSTCQRSFTKKYFAMFSARVLDLPTSCLKTIR